MRNAAARRPFRYSRSSSFDSNVGIVGICIFTLADSAPAVCDDCGPLADMVEGMVSVVVEGAIIDS